MALKPITVNTPAAQAAHILAEDDAALYEGIIGGDCVLPIGGKLNASVISNNKVRITDGMVVVGGHIARIEKGDYEDMTIANGTSGKNRNDLIVARFIAGSSGGADSYKLVVVQGASGATATDPTIVRGDLYNGDKQRDYPLWRIKIEGISIVKVEQMHEIGSTSRNLSESISTLQSDVGTLNRNMDIANANINKRALTNVESVNFGYDGKNAFTIDFNLSGGRVGKLVIENTGMRYLYSDGTTWNTIWSK